MSTPTPPRLMRGRMGAWLSRRVDDFSHVARHPLYWVGAREMAGVSVGLTAWSLMTGVAMVKSGMSLTEAVLMSLLVFAGSAQLAAIPLIAVGAPLWVIFATAICVNLRFVVFSLHLRDYFMFLPKAKRLHLGYFTGDVTYVLFTSRFPKPAQTDTQRRAQMAYLWGGNTTNWLAWQSMSILGIFIGNAFPSRWGLEFAGTLALLGVACSLASTRLRMLSAVVAGAAAIAVYGLPYRLNIVAAISVAVAACMLLEPYTTRPPQRVPLPPPDGEKRG